MEPMALGSPPSPSSPPVNPNFLPAYLMGENQTSTPRNTATSPARNRHVTFNSKTLTSDKRPSLNISRFSGQLAQERSNNNSLNVSEKSGPPAVGLFDSYLDSKTEVVSPVSPDPRQSLKSPVPNVRPGFFQTNSRQNITSPNEELELSTPDSPVRNNSFTRNLNESLSRSLRRHFDNNDQLWVTVIGFPPHAASLVMSQFAQCGTIVDKIFPAEGNWAHLKYSTIHEYNRALTFNGKLISNCLMIGVVPYRCENNKENFSSPPQTKVTRKEPTATTPITPNRARSLSQPYKNKQNTTDVVSPQNVPQKSTGLVSKAMDYVFGW